LIFTVISSWSFILFTGTNLFPFDSQEIEIGLGYAIALQLDTKQARFYLYTKPNSPTIAISFSLAACFLFNIT